MKSDENYDNIQNVTFAIGGIPVDPNIYRDIEIWENVRVFVSENQKGEISLSWQRTPDSYCSFKEDRKQKD